MAGATAQGEANGQSSIPYIAKSYSSSEPDISAHALILSLRPEWSSSRVDLVRFTEGITNTLLKASSTARTTLEQTSAGKHEIPQLHHHDADDDAVLLRAYGPGTDLIIDRDRETQNHELLTRYGLAPALLARFDNGMMYSFIQGDVTSPADLREPHIYKAVARTLAEWHARVPCVPGASAISKRIVIDGYEHDAQSQSGGVNGTNGHRQPQQQQQQPQQQQQQQQHSPQHNRRMSLQQAIDNAAPRKPAPNVWTVMQKWIFALQTSTLEQKERQKVLQKELDKLVVELSNRPGLGRDGLVFAHCDLLSGNVIILPTSKAAAVTTKPGTAEVNGHSSHSSHSQANGHHATSGNNSIPPPTNVAFIDYEYAVPAPAAFDIANHFAEWGGFDCDYTQLPTVPQRREFITEYIQSYSHHAARETGSSHHDTTKPTSNGTVHLSNGNTTTPTPPSISDHSEAVHLLMAEVNLFRGLPGFYWGIWALIQSTISDIDFNYAEYAETRLAEYWAWRAEEDGSRVKSGKEATIRERRWAQEDEEEKV